MVLLSSFWLLFDYRSFQLESTRIRDKHMTEYRDMLQYHVNRVVDEIKYQQSIARNSLEQSLKSRVKLGKAIIQGIFSKYRDQLNDQLLQSLIRDSLRNVRFNKGRDSLFLLNTDGTAELPPLYHDKEPSHLYSRPGGVGSNGVEKILTFVKTAHEGFLQYSIPGRGDNPGEFPVLSYVALLPELDLILGTSEYLADFTDEVQRDVIARTEQIRFGKDSKDYVFITTYDGVSMTYPAKGKNMIKARDPNGVYIVQELIKKAKAGGGFVQYVMPTLGGLESKPKLSYAAPIPEWQWYVGAGVYIDEIDTLIAQNRLAFKNRMKQHLLIMAAVLGGLLILNFLITYLISRKVWQQIDLFSSFFRKASTESISMETKLLAYKEFREISRLANKMLRDRNNILQEIQLSRDEWVNTFNAIGDCIFILDRDGNIEKANESAGEFFATPPAEFTGKAFKEFCKYENPVQQTLEDQTVHTMEIQVADRGLNLLTSSFPLFSETGELRRIIVISHDITEQKQLEQQLLHAQKLEAIGTLAGGIAHDFNNVLAAILGYTELAYNFSKENQPIDNYLEQVLKAGKRARNLVKQILAFSRQAESEKTVIRPAELVTEALQLLRSSLPTTITIKQEIDLQCGTVLVDPTQLHQIVMNVCTNAYHAMEEKGGTLSVKLRQYDLDATALTDHHGPLPGLYLELQIQDEGCGIPPELQKKIFEPFFTTKDPGKGTGMGLAIVHGIVKDCGGFVDFTSIPGEGTTFSIKLPVHTGEHPSHSEHTELLPPADKHILIVDDEKMLMEMNSILLERLGFTVSPFSSSIEALAAFEKNPEKFDLVITDQTMPEMTGFDLAHNLLRLQPGLPIILCTGYSSMVSAEEARNAGIKGFAMKPLVQDEIIRKINEVLS